MYCTTKTFKYMETVYSLSPATATRKKRAHGQTAVDPSSYHSFNTQSSICDSNISMLDSYSSSSSYDLELELERKEKNRK